MSQRQPHPAQGLAPRALAQELRRKGVDDETAEAALDELDPAEEEAAARELVRRKLRTLRGSTTRRPPAGWSACWPARATPRGWPSPWCATSWALRAGRVWASPSLADVRVDVVGVPTVTGPVGSLSGAELGGRRAHVALTALALAGGPLTSAALAELVWRGAPPQTWPVALRGVVRGLRAAPGPSAAVTRS